MAGRTGKRMPAALWEEAAELAEELGCYRVSRELGLNYASLRGRVRSRPAGRASVARVRGASAMARSDSTTMPAFAAVDLDAVFGSRQPAAQLEVVRADGARMQIRVPCGGGNEIAAIVSAFLGDAP